MQILSCLLLKLQPPWPFSRQHPFLATPSFPCRGLPPLRRGVHSEQRTQRSAAERPVHHTPHPVLHHRLWSNCSPQIQLIPVHFPEVLLPTPGYLYSRPLSQAFPLQDYFLPNPGSRTEPRKSTILAVVYWGGNGILSPVSIWEDRCYWPKKFPSSFDDPTSRLCALQISLSGRKPILF